MSIDCTVFIPAFNAASYVSEAIDSVLAQTGPSFELLIVDDASHDGTDQVIARYAQDARLRVIRQTHQQGVSAAGNIALQQAKGRYLIRLDADDRAWPGRLMHQVQVLDQYPHIAVLGGVMQVLGDLETEQHLPGDDASIKSNFMTASGNICNPASAMRLDFVRRSGIQYDHSLQIAEDLAFWIDVMCAGGQFMNTSQVVTLYRTHAHQVSQVRQAQLEQVLPRLRQRLLLRWFQQLSDEQAEIVASLFGPGQLSLNKSTLQAALQWLEELQHHTTPSTDGENRTLVLRYFRHFSQLWTRAMHPPS